MIINLKDLLFSLEGKPFMRNEKEQWSVGTALCEASLFQEKDEKLKADDHIFRYELAKKCLGEQNIFTCKEIEFLREQLSKSFPTEFVGTIFQKLPK